MVVRGVAETATWGRTIVGLIAQVDPVVFVLSATAGVTLMVAILALCFRSKIVGSPSSSAQTSAAPPASRASIENNKLHSSNCGRSSKPGAADDCNHKSQVSTGTSAKDKDKDKSTAGTPAVVYADVYEEILATNPLLLSDPLAYACIPGLAEALMKRGSQQKTQHQPHDNTESTGINQTHSSVTEPQTCSTTEVDICSGSATVNDTASADSCCAKRTCSNSSSGNGNGSSDSTNDSNTPATDSVETKKDSPIISTDDTNQHPHND
ncbi:hypothetical protein Pelo_2603 [Pelomyxa schiedti]|nr:hypothetical protein Pelo_2603 [Pelomyxa schiedti]